MPTCVKCKTEFNDDEGYSTTLGPMCEYCADPFDEDCYTCGKLIAGDLKDKNVAKKIKEGYLCRDCMKLELEKCQGCGSMVPKSELKLTALKSNPKKQKLLCNSCISDQSSLD